MAASFKAQKIRTSAIIGSGSFTSTRPTLLIYSSSVADASGDLSDTGVYAKVGRDAFLFVSGTIGGKGTTGVSAFGGDVVISGTIYNADGTPYSVSGGTPAGSDGQVQFNNAGAFGAHNGLVYNKNTATLTVGNLVVTGAITTITTSNLVVSDPVIYVASGSTASNTNGGIAIASGSSFAHQSLVFGRVANDTWGAGRLDVAGGTITDLTAMSLAGVRASKFEVGSSSTALSSSTGQDVILYSGGGSYINLVPGSVGLRLGSSAGPVAITGSNVRIGNISTAFGNELPSLPGNDTYFFVSGSVGSRGGSSRGAAVFGGDTVVSGSIYGLGPVYASGSSVFAGSLVVKDDIADTAQLTLSSSAGAVNFDKYSDGNLYITDATAGGELWYSAKAPNGINANIIRIVPKNFGQSVFNFSLGGLASSIAANPLTSTDTNFYVEGVPATRGSSTRGTAVFGGDLVVTGTLAARSGLSGSLTRLLDGTSYLIAGSNVTILTGSKGQVTISSTGGGGTPGGSTTQVQFNNAGAFGGSPGLVYSSATETMSVGSLNVTGSILTVTGTVDVRVPEAASSFVIRSDGSPLVPFFAVDTDALGFGFGAASSESYEFNKLKGGDLDRVLFLSGGGPTSPNIRSATDFNFFVSGSVGSKGRSPGTAVFGGDTVVSGTLYIGDSTTTSSRRLISMGVTEITGSTYITGSTSLLGVGRTELSTDSSNDFYLNNTLPGKLSYFGVSTTEGVTTNFLRVRPNSVPQNTLVSFLQGLGGHNTVTPLGQTDTNFFVGGKIGSIGGATRGTAVFAGDLVVSGSAAHEGNVTMKADILPDGDRTRNLGAPNLRWANVYTGDLHLRNERGDYTLIEEEDCLTIRFNKTGKRYRFVLERAPELDEDPIVR